VIDLERLDERRIDVLKEVGVIGSGNAATSLSAMIGRRVNISVPNALLLDRAALVREFGGPDEFLIGLPLIFDGDISGRFLFLLRESSARVIIEGLTGESLVDVGDLDEYFGSAVQEACNIMAASYVSAIAAFMDFEIHITPPELHSGKASDIFAAIPTDADPDGKMIVIQCEMEKKENDPRASCYVAMIPKGDSLAKILDKLSARVII